MVRLEEPGKHRWWFGARVGHGIQTKLPSGQITGRYDVDTNLGNVKISALCLGK